MKVRGPLVIAAALLCLVSAVDAQQDTSAQRDSADVLLVDQDLTGRGEFVRVFLERRQVYRAELSSSQVSLSITAYPSGPPAFFAREEAASRASGTTVFSIYPRADQEHEIRVLGQGAPAVRLRLYRDLSASRRRARVLDEPGWEIGAEVSVGYFSGYLVGSGSTSFVESDEGGATLQGCFSARNGPGSLRLWSGCALGFAWDSRPGGADVIWVFLEPRLRLFGSRPRGQPNTEAGVLFRAGAGMVERTSNNPIVLAPGIFVAHHRRNAQGRGVGFTLSAQHGFLKGTHGVGDQSTDRILLGIGYFH